MACRSESSAEAGRRVAGTSTLSQNALRLRWFGLTHQNFLPCARCFPVPLAICDAPSEESCCALFQGPQEASEAHPISANSTAPGHLGVCKLQQACSETCLTQPRWGLPMVRRQPHGKRWPGLPPPVPQHLRRALLPCGARPRGADAPWMHSSEKPLLGCGRKPSDAPCPTCLAGEAAINDGNEVDFKKVSEEEALSILKVRPARPPTAAGGLAAARRWRW